MIPYDGFTVSMVAPLRKVLVIRCLSDCILCSHVQYCLASYHFQLFGVVFRGYSCLLALGAY